jgi:hypothetical protein
MTTVTDIAERILAENNYTTSDISATNVEYLIRNAIDYINLMAGTSITFVPSAGSEDLTASDSEIVLVKTLTALLIRAHLDKGPQVGVGGVSVTAVISDPQYRLFSKIVNQGINRLVGRSFNRT